MKSLKYKSFNANLIFHETNISPQLAKNSSYKKTY